MRSHILYHGNCADGFAAACIMSHALCLRQQDETVTMQPLSHDDYPYPQHLRADAGEEVFYVDYTPPASIIHLLMGSPQDSTDLVIPQVALLTIIDHHADKTKLHEGLQFSEDTPVRSIFDTTKSGARLTWEHHFPLPVPPALQLLDWYDLGGPWQHPEDERSERAQNLQAGLMRGMPRTQSAWLPVLLDITNGALIEETIDRGRKFREAAKGIIAAACSSHLWLSIDGHRVPAVTGLSMEHSNDAATLLLEMYPNTAPFAAVFYVQPQTGNIKYSLRSRKGDIDVSAIAARMAYGGGGHPKAAGYSSQAPLPLAA